MQLTEGFCTKGVYSCKVRGISVGYVFWSPPLSILLSLQNWAWDRRCGLVNSEKGWINTQWLLWNDHLNIVQNENFLFCKTPRLTHHDFEILSTSEIFPAELLPNHKYSPLCICISVLLYWSLSYLTKDIQKISILSMQFPGLHLIAKQRHRDLWRAVQPNCPRCLDFTWTIANYVSRISTY